MKTVYFEATAGIAGDMTVAALLDAAADRDRAFADLRDALTTLAIDGLDVRLEPVVVDGLAACRFHVDDSDCASVHRDWRTIRALIEAAGRRGLAAAVVERAVAIFARLAEAEARVHDTTPDRVHFHEVGAIDSIVDIVAAAWCLEHLGIERCFVGAIPSGSGHVDCAHGCLPVPVPAVVELLEGFEVIAGDGHGEVVTPTGAAILAAEAHPLRPQFRLERVGTGAGTRTQPDRPNVLRVFVGDSDEEHDVDCIVLEADIDDMTPEALAWAAEVLRSAGALDVSVAPVAMKKNRLAMRLVVLATMERFEALTEKILAETSSLGVRMRFAHRRVLPRRSAIVDTDWGPVAVKVAVRPDGEETVEPEFDDVARLAREHRLGFLELRDVVLRLWHQDRHR